MNITVEQVAKDLADIKVIATKNETAEVYKTCLAALDLTTLSPTDTESSVRALARRTMDFYTAYPKLQNVASICVHPPFVECVGLEIDGTPMRITSVAGGFPASQTFVEVKALEIAMAVESGADEIDIVIPVGKCLEGQFEEAESEVKLLRKECGDAVLKVILETGELQDPQIIFDASMASMRAGADFIKTSTGKVPVSATPEAVVAMCYAIKEYASSTGLQVGIKVAGGVKTATDAALYYTIVEQILGVQWLTPALFRIGASAAANTILSAIVGSEVKHF
ncbi:MAG: deoxyribose-phosphate aldolase [Rikenellaceae bacterium]